MRCVQALLQALLLSSSPPHRPKIEKHMRVNQYGHSDKYGKQILLVLRAHEQGALSGIISTTGLWVQWHLFNHRLMCLVASFQPQAYGSKDKHGFYNTRYNIGIYEVLQAMSATIVFDFCAICLCLLYTRRTNKDVKFTF